MIAKMDIRWTQKKGVSSSVARGGPASCSTNSTGGAPPCPRNCLLSCLICVQLWPSVVDTVFRNARATATDCPGPQAALNADAKTIPRLWAYAPVRKWNPPADHYPGLGRHAQSTASSCRLEGKRGLKLSHARFPKARLFVVLLRDVTAGRPRPRGEGVHRRRFANAYEKLSSIGCSADRPLREVVARNCAMIVALRESEAFEIRPEPSRRLGGFIAISAQYAGPLTPDNREKPRSTVVTEQIAGEEISRDGVECATAAVFHASGAGRAMPEPRRSPQPPTKC